MKSKNKLKKRKQFNWTFKNGKSVHSKNLVIVYNKNKGKDFKVGFSVTKKVGKAVVRNKIKRRLKEIVSKLTSNIKNYYTIILVAKPSIVDCKFVDLQSEVELILKKTNLFKEIWKKF